MASGGHDREAFVRVFLTLYKNQHTGVLDIQFGKKSPELYFLEEIPWPIRPISPKKTSAERTRMPTSFPRSRWTTCARNSVQVRTSREHAIVMSGALSARQIAERTSTPASSPASAP